MLYTLFKKYRFIILYFIFGGLTTAVNIGVFYLFMSIFHASTFMSTSIAWGSAVIFAFSTNKHFIFQSTSWNTHIVLKELLTFVSYRLSTGILDIVITVIGIDYLHYNSLFVKISSNVIVLILNYFTSKFFVFKRSKSDIS